MKFLSCLFAFFVLIFFVSACSEESEHKGKKKVAQKRVAQLTVYKTPDCDCCHAWINHLLSSGFDVDVVQQKSINHIKALYGVPAYTPFECSSHIAINDDGFVFEGRVPAKYIERFLSELPKGAVGLLVSTMPHDRGVMESSTSINVANNLGSNNENTFKPYQILQLQKDGSTRAYQKVEHYHQQFN